MNQPASICFKCKHSMLTKILVMVQAAQEIHGKPVIIGAAPETVIQAWCFCRGAGVPIQFPVVECEGFEPATEEKTTRRPSDFEVKVEN